MIYALIIGALAGFLAGKLTKGEGFGLLWNIVLGIVGAFVAKFIFGALGVGGGGLLWDIISATLGAILVLFIAGKVKK